MQLTKRILDVKVMQEILDCFVELTGIRAAFFDEYGENINGKNKDICSFCRIIREYKQIYSGCIESDHIAFKEALDNKKTYLYKCHMMLWEAVVPLFIKNKISGYLMIGQVKDDDTDCSNWNVVLKYLIIEGVNQQKIEQIKQAYDDIQATGRKKIEAAAKMLEITARYIIDTDIIRIYEPEIIEKTKYFIRLHFKEHMTMKEMANAVNVSPSYLSFLFRKVTAQTITEYIEELRLEFARDLLLTTSLTIKEISVESGYIDQNYFSRLFKKYEKMSPLAYRKKNKI